MILPILMAVTFVAGIILIALEDTIKVNKAAVSVGMCILLWGALLTHVQSIYINGTPEMIQVYQKAFPEVLSQYNSFQIASMYISKAITRCLGDVSSTLFFVLASMALVGILDAFGAFKVISRSIKTRSKRSLVWVFAFITFFLSPMLGNLATVIIVISILTKIIPDRDTRLPYSCLCIIAANAGGCWSPIGDVTTLLLWSGGNINVLTQISRLILPALVTCAIPALVVSLGFAKGETVGESSGIEAADPADSIYSDKFRNIMLAIGLISLISVPVLQSLFGVPSYMCVLGGVVILWILTDIKSARSDNPLASKNKVSNLFSNLDMPTILFFLGILMSVEALKEIGVLTNMAHGLDSVIPQPNIIAFLLGICSSFLDNVALVAATMGMYPLAETGAYMANSEFWIFLAYCAVTGGSILIIGSASGVTVMGLEKIKFGYYFKKFTPLALIAYLCGAGVFVLLSLI